MMMIINLSKQRARSMSCMMRTMSKRSRVSWSIGTRTMVRSLRIHSSSFILDISNESSLVISSVGDNLNPSIRQSYSVLSCHHTILILYLLLSKVSSRVRILITIVINTSHTDISDVLYLNSVFISKRSWRNLDIRIMMKGSAVMQRTMSRTNGTKLRSSSHQACPRQHQPLESLQ